MSGRIVEVSVRAGLLLSVSLLAMPAVAQSLEDAAEDAVLGTIVVTPSRTEQTLMDVTRSVATVEESDIEETSTNDVAELLRDIPGVTVLEGITAGLRRISIRGEGQARNTILIDGQEVSDHSTYGSLFMINPADIERIEVVKGPSSVLHGSKAIGGVVNIITKKGANKPLEVSVGGGFDSSTGGYNANASAAGSKGNLDYRISVTRADHGDRETPEGTLKATALSNGSAFENQSISASLGYTAENHSFRVVAEKIEMETDAYVDPDSLSASGIPGLNKFKLDLPQRDRTKFGFFYDGTDISDHIKKVHFDAYWQQIDRKIDIDYMLVAPTGPALSAGSPPSIIGFNMAGVDTHNQTRDEQVAIGANGQIDLQLHEDHLTILGFQFVKDSIDRVDVRNGERIAGLAGVTSTPGGPAPVFPYTETGRTAFTDNFEKEASISTFSAFVQDEWDLTEDFSVTAGARYFHIETELSKTTQPGYSTFDNTDDAIIGSIGVNYTGLKNVALRANISQGYVYPTLLQNMLGSVFSPGEVIEANPDLVAEKSINYEIGARYDNGKAILDAAAFISVAEDYIDTADCGTEVTCTGVDASTKYVNIDAATTYGFEISGSYVDDKWGLMPYFTATAMVRNFDNNGVETNNTDIPLLSGRIGLKKNWDITDQAQLLTDLYVRGASNRDNGSTEHDSFATVNLAASMNYEFDDDRNFRLNAAVENIFDKSYIEPLASMPAAGRTFKVSAQLTY